MEGLAFVAPAGTANSNLFTGRRIGGPPPVRHKSSISDKRAGLDIAGFLAVGGALGALASLVPRKARGGEDVKFRKRSDLTLPKLFGFTARDQRKRTHEVPMGQPVQRLFSFRNRQFWNYRVNPVNYFTSREWERKDKLYTLLFLIMHAGALAAPFFFTWEAFGLFVALYCVQMLGITISYHRQLSHKGFKSRKWVEYLWAYIGMTALQGHPTKWVLWHRQHHAMCDKESDVHSPLDGIWWSHMGWELQSKERWVPHLTHTVKDLQSQWFYRHVGKWHHVYATLLPIAVLAKLGGLPFVLWGFFARVVAGWHATGAVNSVCHIWGFQDWKTGDLSMNNWLVALLAMGEGWHNNHHAFEQSVRHGLKWWQIDVTWYAIVAMEKLGLAWDLKYPSERKMRKLAMNGDDTLRAHGVEPAAA